MAVWKMRKRLVANGAAELIAPKVWR